MAASFINSELDPLLMVLTWTLCPWYDPRHRSPKSPLVITSSIWIWAGSSSLQKSKKVSLRGSTNSRWLISQGMRSTEASMVPAGPLDVTWYPKLVRDPFVQFREFRRINKNATMKMKATSKKAERITAAIQLKPVDSVWYGPISISSEFEVRKTSFTDQGPVPAGEIARTLKSGLNWEDFIQFTAMKIVIFSLSDSVWKGIIILQKCSQKKFSSWNWQFNFLPICLSPYYIFWKRFTNYRCCDRLVRKWNLVNCVGWKQNQISRTSQSTLRYA